MKRLKPILLPSPSSTLRKIRSVRAVDGFKSLGDNETHGWYYRLTRNLGVKVFRFAEDAMREWKALTILDGHQVAPEPYCLRQVRKGRRKRWAIFMQHLRGSNCWVPVHRQDPRKLTLEALYQTMREIGIDHEDFGGDNCIELPDGSIRAVDFSIASFWNEGEGRWDSWEDQ